MDTALSRMDVDDPSAKVDEDTEMGDVAPQAIQKQEKQKKDKKEKEKRDGKDKEKKSRSHQNGEVELTKRKHIEVNDLVGTEGKKKKKTKSSVE